MLIAGNSLLASSNLFRLHDVISLTDFQRNTRAHINRLKKSGRPLVLTINGRAAVVLNNATDYEAQQSALHTRELLQSLERGIASMKRGGGRPFEQVAAEIYDRYIDASGRARPRRRKAS